MATETQRTRPARLEAVSAEAPGQVKRGRIPVSDDDRFKLLFDNANDMIGFVSRTGKILDLNKRTKDILGYEPEELIGRNFLTTGAIAARNILTIGRLFKESVKTGTLVNAPDGRNITEVWLKHRDGRLLLAEASTSIIRKNGRLEGFLSILRDITERKQAEDRLSGALEWREAIFQGSLDAVFITDEDSKFVMVNHRACDLTGYSQQELLGMRIPDLHEPQDLTAYNLYHDRIMSGEEIVSEAKLLRKDRTKIDTEFSNRRLIISGKVYMHTIAHDITDRNKRKSDLLRALESAQRREAELDAMLKAAKTVLESGEFEDTARKIFDHAKRIIGATAGYVALLSKDGRENEVLFLDSGGLDCTVDPDLPMPLRGLRGQVYRTGKAVYENRFDQSEPASLLPKGHVRLRNVMFAPLVLEGKAVGVIGLANKATDFTEQDTRLAEGFGQIAALALSNSLATERLQQSQAKLKSIIDHSEEVFFIHDTNKVLTYLSPQSEKVFGYKPEEMMVDWTTLLTDNPINQKGIELTERAIRTGKKQPPYLVEVRRKDGEPAIIQVEKSPIKDEDGRVVALTGALRDVTVQQKAEENAMTAARLNQVLLNAMPCVVMLIRSHSREVVACNEEAARAGVTPGRACFEGWGKLDVPCPGCLAPQLWKTGQTQHRQVIESGRVWDTRWVPVSEDLYMYYAYDITQIKRMEQALRNSERKYRDFFENDLTGNFIATADGRLLDCNQALLDIFGFRSFDEAKSVHMQSLYPNPQARERMLEKIRKEKKIFHYEQELLKTSGKKISVVQNAIGEFDDKGTLTHIRGHVIEITAVRKAGEKLLEYQAKLKALTAELLRTEEREKRRIAVGLHDHICQKLVLTKLAIESSIALAANPELGASLKIASESIGEVIEDAESLTFELSNPLLREFGLGAAMDQQLAQINKEHGITCNLDDRSGDRMSDELEHSLFRIARELLTNAVKHSEASEIRVSIHRSRDDVRVTVEDNGVGFKESEAPEKSSTQRFGLFSVREQLASMGGQLIIESGPGQGSKITAVTPIDRSGHLQGDCP